MKNEENEDKILYEEFINSNMKSYETLMNKYKNNLLYFIFRYVKNEDTAEDIYQEVCLYILDKKQVYNDSYSFKSFLYMLAKSRSLNYLRSEKIQNDYLEKEDILEKEESILEEIILEKELNHELNKVIRKLNKDYQMVVFLNIIEDLSYLEVAKIMNKNVSQIKNLVHRAKIKLRNLLIKEKIVEITSSKKIKFLIMLISFIIITSGMVYATITIFQSYHIPKDDNYINEAIQENFEYTSEEIKYSMHESYKNDNFLKLGKYVIYALKYKDEIYCFDLENKTGKKLCDFKGVDKIYFDGEYVYAMPHHYNGKGIYKIDLNGNIQKIYDGESIELWITENEIFFIDQIGYDSINQTPQGTICRMDKNGNNKKEIVKNVKNYFYIAEDKIYYVDKDNRNIYRCDLYGNEKEEIAQGRCFLTSVTKDYLIYLDYTCFITGEGTNDFRIVYLDNLKNEVIGPGDVLDSDNGIDYYTQTILVNGDKYLNTRELGTIDLERKTKDALWKTNEDINFISLNYAFNNRYYFYTGGKYQIINLDNKEDKSELDWNIVFFLDGKSYEFIQEGDKVNLRIYNLNYLEKYYEIKCF